MNLNPTDVVTSDVYWPPFLIVFTLSLVAMAVTVYLLNRYRLSRYFMFPWISMAAIMSIYIVVIGTFIIPI